MSFCSPNNKKKSFTCFERNDLVEISKIINKKDRICNDKKCTTTEVVKTDYDNITKKDLWEVINSNLKKVCKNEYCWSELKIIDEINNKDARERIKKYTFKPKSTKTDQSWFSTKDINDVLYQYERLVNDEKKDSFKFLGAVPSDVSRVIDLKYNTLKKKYDTIGIVFNTDTHKRPGQHWLATFIDNKHRTIEYFDSLGKAPNKYIREFLLHFKGYTLVMNEIPHQTAGSQCGSYSCYFIIQKLKGKTFNEINSIFITEDMMIKNRKNIFRPYK